MDAVTTLESVIQTAIDSALKELHTCFPAVVTRVSGQLIDCQITIQRKLNNKNVNLPLLTNVPIRYLKTKNFSISIPIEVGDHVLVIFCERNIDNWLLNAGINAPIDTRKHHLSDAFAFPMMYPETDTVPSFNSQDLEIKHKSGSPLIRLKNSGGVDIIGDINLTGDIQMSGIITGDNVFNGADSNTHIHPQNAGDHFGGSTSTGVPQ